VQSQHTIMRSFVAVLFFAIVVGANARTLKDAPVGKTLLFSDEFDGVAIDTTKWNYTVPKFWYASKRQEQTYTTDPQNIGVSNGNLYITARKDNGNVTSGWIHTADTFLMKPGMIVNNATVDTVYVELRIKAPQPSQSSWPAAWLNPKNITYGPSPASGEMDIFEMINDMRNQHNVVHYGDMSYPQNERSKSVNTRLPNGAAWSDDFHIYAMTWTYDRITMFVDGTETMTIGSKNVDPNGWFTPCDNGSLRAPFDIDFYLILNYAISGSWPGPSDNTSVFPNTMLVDYVRIYSI
jgi:beta-glucanase (GH16 family)